MRILYLDCFSGISGDMLAGALAEFDDGLEVLRKAVSDIGVSSLDVRDRPVTRAGIGATKIDVLVDGECRDDPGILEPAARHAHEHRTLAEIESILSASRLSPRIRDRCLDVFRRIVDAESEVHRIPPGEVHLHEVGALDAVADIVGVVALVDRIAPDRVIASPVNVGGGSVTCEHGVYPAPGPAATRLLRGAPVYSSGEPFELVTPTGAALLATLVDAFGPIPAMTLRSVGTGAGRRDIEGRPNVLRALLGDGAERPDAEVIVVECTIDDMNPQNYGHLLERLDGVGALEVTYCPVQMKKNRPGTHVTVLCREPDLAEVSRVLFTETTTIGFRYRRESRRELERRFERVETPFGSVSVKVSTDGDEVMSVQPEYEDCRKIAAGAGVPLKEVQAAALEAWRRSAGASREARTGPREEGHRGRRSR